MPEQRFARQPLQLTIPGRARLVLTHVVLDFNGTLACDGKLITGVATRLRALSWHFVVAVLTADTHGTARQALRGVALTPVVVANAAAKRRVLDASAWEHALVIGNGRNDAAMLRAAGIAVVVVGPEGAAAAALRAADIVVSDVRDALDLPLHPQRLVATLRS